MAREHPDGTVTFLFTDIEGSTKLWEQRPDEMRASLEDHDDLTRAAIADNDGYVFATGGDGFAAAFAVVNDAIEAAAVAQVGFIHHDFLRVRMGIHTGEAQLRGGDYFGSAVNKAARIMAAGHGGQTLMSGTTATLVEGHPLKNLGEHRLRDLEGETVIWQLGTDDFEQLRTLDRLPGNLPVQRTSFIGRTEEVKTVQAAVGESRLVTLVGPGGVGKSRLALQAAAELSDDFPGGVWFAPLGSLTEDGLVPATIASAVGVVDRRGETAEESLVHWFGPRKALLIIDNCEHLLDATAALVDRLLDIKSDSRIIATSQAPLSIRGEAVHLVEPLMSGGSAGESVQLFAERAAAVRTGFRVTAENEEAVVEICDRLDHIPLAIELAASRVRAMSPADIARRLDQRLRLLSSGDRAGPGRHRTLEAALRWSYELLDPTQQLVLSRLAVFGASFSLEAAEAIVADGETVEEWEILDVLTALVDKSLVVASVERDSTRYNLLESIRQFGLSELDGRKLRMDRYAEHFGDLVLDRASDLLGPRDQETFDELNREWDHVRVALRAAVDSQDLERFEEMFLGLAPLFLGRGRLSEGCLWGMELLEFPVENADRRAASLGVAALLANNVDFAKSMRLVAMSRELCAARACPPAPVAVSVEALLAVMDNDNERAGELLAELTPLVSLDGPPSFAVAQCMTAIVAVSGLLGRFDGLHEISQAHLAYVQRCGSSWMRSSASSAISPFLYALDPDNALSVLEEGVVFAEEIHNELTVAHVAMFLALAQMRSGDRTAAAGSLARAARAAAESAPAYLGQQVNAAVGISMREWPRTAAELLGGLARWRDLRGLAGTALEADAEVAYAERLRAELSEDFERCHDRGRERGEEELVGAMLTVLRAIEADTMTDDILGGLS